MDWWVRSAVITIGTSVLLAASGTAQNPETLARIPQYVALIPDQSDASRAIGLPSLARAKLPGGAREVRLWVSGPGPVLASRVLRLVETPDSLWGEVFQWWFDQEDPTPPVDAREDSSCRWVPSQTASVRPAEDPETVRPMRVVACRLELPPTDWHPIMQRLDGLQVWSLPSMEVLHWGPDGLEFTKWVDGTHLVGETLEGQSYHAFYWPQPDVQQDPAGNVAQEIVELVFQLERIGRSSSDR